MDLHEFLENVETTPELIKTEYGYQTETLYDAENMLINGIDQLNSGYNYQELYVSKTIDGLTLTDEQYDAVIESLQTRLYILTGGPGVGKTTTVKALINAHKLTFGWSNDRILLMAPTGKAAARMSEQTGMTATTIHKTLRVPPGNYELSETTLEALSEKEIKLIVLDEASMLDTQLAALIIDTCLNLDSCKLILVGDQNQLPSIGPGQVLKDLLTLDIPSKTLTVVQRQAENSPIIELAQMVAQGEFPNQDWFQSKKDVYFVNEKPEKLIQTLQSNILQPRMVDLSNFQLLTPYRNIGKPAMYDSINELNHYTQNWFNTEKTDGIDLNYNGIGRYFKLWDRVICKQNRNDSIVNGSIGYIKDIVLGHKNPDHDFIEVDFNGITENFYRENNDWAAIELAYAMTIHSSQGSEYETVIIPLVRNPAFNSGFLNRNLLYTALTRAKEELVFVGNINHFKTVAATEMKNRRTRLQKAD